MTEVRRSATGRAVRMAAMTAGVTGSYLGSMLQRFFLDEDTSRERLKTTHAKVGKRMARELQELRGPAMKLGQLLSLQTGVLPDETVAELATLQREAPPMHPTLARAQFRAALGADPEQVFRSFDDQPFAAASLGQVHHAVTTRGERVAVKIQYPGIRDAVAGDFRWFRAFSKTSQVHRYFPEPLLAELEEQITAETDYVHEAGNLEHIRKALQPLPWVTVPRLYPKHSGDTVITLEFLEGETLDAFLARRPGRKLRDLVGERLFELFYFQVLSVGAFHADPHWGNYLFQPDGRIGLVDFGCVKYLTPKFVENLRTVYLYPGPRDSPDFRRLLETRYAPTKGKLTPNAHRALVRFSKEFYGRVYPPEPEKEAIPFDFSDGDFLRMYIRLSHELTKAKASLPEYIFLARAETGLYNTLHRLRARVHTSRIVRKYLSSAAMASS